VVLEVHQHRLPTCTEGALQCRLNSEGITPDHGLDRHSKDGLHLPEKLCEL